MLLWLRSCCVMLKIVLCIFCAVLYHRALTLSTWKSLMRLAFLNMVFSVNCQCIEHIVVYCRYLKNVFLFTGVSRITYWSQGVASLPHKCQPPSLLLDNIRVMMIVWRLRGNIIRTAACWVVWHNVHSQQHTHMSSSYRSSRLGLSHWDPYAMHRGGGLELYYCNMVEWCWWDSSLICKTNWFPSVLWHCWFGHMICKNRPRYDL